MARPTDLDHLFESDEEGEDGNQNSVSWLCFLYSDHNYYMGNPSVRILSELDCAHANTLASCKSIKSTLMLFCLT